MSLLYPILRSTFSFSRLVIGRSWCWWLARNPCWSMMFVEPVKLCKDWPRCVQVFALLRIGGQRVGILSSNVLCLFFPSCWLSIIQWNLPYECILLHQAAKLMDSGDINFQLKVFQQKRQLQGSSVDGKMISILQSLFPKSCNPCQTRQHRSLTTSNAQSNNRRRYTCTQKPSWLGLF